MRNEYYYVSKYIRKLEKKEGKKVLDISYYPILA
jgi:hypothetical protein